MRTGTLTALAIMMLSLPGNAQSQDDTVQAQLRTLKAENDMLKKALEARAKEIADMKAEVTRLKAEAEPLRPGTARVDQAPTSQPAGSSTQPGKNPNTVVVQAIMDYRQAVGGLGRDSQLTDLQRRTKFLEAVKKLDSILRKNKVVVTFKIDDVLVQRDGAVVLVPSSIRIKSSDQAIPDVVLTDCHQIEVVMPSDEANKIVKGSEIAIEGHLATNARLSRPDEEQLAYEGYMAGCRLLGSCRAGTQPSYSDGTVLVIQTSCTVNIGGTPRKLK